MRQPWRLTVVGAVFLGFFAILVLRLWYLQVSSLEDSLDSAESQQLSTVTIEAPRGNIYDRNGILMAGTEAALRIVVDRKLVPEDREEELIQNLAALLDRPASDIRHLFEDRGVGARFTVGGEVSERTAMFAWEHIEGFPGLAIEPQPVRIYPLHEQAAHLIGYIGAPGEADLLRPEVTPRDRVGKFGVEGSYDRQLRGTPGTITYRVNARGQILGIVEETPPIPGGSVTTSIDLHMQTVLEAALVDGMSLSVEAGNEPVRASGVILDPSDGSVLAMASVPSYDPTLFSDGLITQAEWESLSETNALNNFAIQGNYAPASTFKVVPYTLALIRGIYPTIEQDEHPGQQDPSDPTSFFCDGTLQFPNTPLLHDWAAHGEVDIHTSLQVSCDMYYWGIALQIWENAGDLWDENLLQDWARELGFGARTGVDLPFESPGLVPDREWFQYHQVKKDGLVREEGGWAGGDVMNMTIGQGSLTATPLQMAVAYATLVNGGTFYAPRVVDEVVDIKGTVVFRNLPNIVRKVDIPDVTVDSLKEDLHGVVAGPRGTSRVAFSEFCGADVRAADCESLKQVGGKTGTAEVRVALTEEDEEVDTAWFIGVAPLDDPRFVVVIVIEEGGSGGGVAAPTARAILQYLMEESVTPIRSGGENTE
ncbi:MAG: penicillin-binding protein 2 [Actinobacteria bacterium]|nr:penicillin-binding protein 2 [Actinomycetota bacterium]MBU1493867.1 penicillin-binding protein 2 [Actinomycetota bacterium]